MVFTGKVHAFCWTAVTLSDCLPGFRYTRIPVVIYVWKRFTTQLVIIFTVLFLPQMFHFPLLVVSCHLVLKFTLAIIGRFLYHKTMKIPFVKVSLDSNISKLAPVGISGGIDVGLSNWGLELVNVSLYVLLFYYYYYFKSVFSNVFYSGTQWRNRQLLFSWWSTL